MNGMASDEGIVDEMLINEKEITEALIRQGIIENFRARLMTQAEIDEKTDVVLERDDEGSTPDDIILHCCEEIPRFSICSCCEHFIRHETIYKKLPGLKLPHRTYKMRCKAFPDGIPLRIWLGENDHTKPFPGDHGSPSRKLGLKSMTILSSEYEEQERTKRGQFIPGCFKTYIGISTRQGTLNAHSQT